ncbi:NAD(P)/FAD-dependent oxidoreductase [Roseiarcaceae bacterium H3SJ34-1]|uniref:FAD-dependent oxidoreductase n=1 Tax=Terripilifer ovatus TaxID=3032367 RepID=UPI003AB9892F|nr:NAD(P)/FAD-dependent oxidoreductase [Roseiarcaceae bacterium H3SJ34-1]
MALKIAIAGSGPAGLATALLLHRDGHRITVFERFDAPQPVGSGLMIQPTGLAVLQAMGLDAPVLAAGARIDRLFGQATPSERTVLDVRYAALGKDIHFGIGIHRAALFDILFRSVQATGISIATSHTVTGAPLLADGRRELVFASGARAGPFDLIVDTLGTASPLCPPLGGPLAYGALWASLDWPDDAGFNVTALEQRYVRASTMVGVLPVGLAPGSPKPKAAFFWSLRTDRLQAWREAGLDRWKEEVRSVWPATAPLLDQIVTPEQLTFARYTHRTLEGAAETSLIHLGDAWHATSPQLGQGANMALLDAFALAKSLRETDDLQHALERTVAVRRRHIRLYQGMSLLFTPVYQSDSTMLPWLRDRVVGPLARLWPATTILAAMVSGLIGRPLKPLGLAALAASEARRGGLMPGHEQPPQHGDRAVEQQADQRQDEDDAEQRVDL